MTSNLWKLIEPSLLLHGDDLAWICRQQEGRREVQFRQIHQAVLVTAQKLRNSGIGAGATVGITAPNGPEWTVAALAAWRIGCMIAPIHIGNSDHDIAAQIDAVKPDIMLVHGSGIVHEPRMEITLDADEELAAAENAIAAADDPDAVAARLYTSGSTGNPKVVRLSHGNLAANVLAAVKIQRFGPGDRFLSLLPFSHAMGITANVNLPYYVGASLVTPKVLAASEIVAALEEEKVTVVIAVPRLYRNVMLGLEKKFREGGKGLAIYRRVLRAAPPRLRQILNAPLRKRLGGRINVWVSGGSHLDGRITRFYQELGLPLRQGYGLTETAPLACIQENFDSAPESVGKPVEHVQVRVNEPDESGQGEIWIKGPNVMLGYEDPEQTAQALEDGWFKTGDIGRIDDQGRVTLTGRLKRLIVTEAGKNVYPEELETLLERDPAIKEAGVLEVDMRPACVLAMDGDDTAGEARRVIREFNALVSAHNRISRFAVVEELPRTPLGKIALQELPAIFEAHEIGAGGS